jgi:Flp pilus assembly pilin Flp
MAAIFDYAEDESAAALSEYALVLSVFALLLFGALYKFMNLPGGNLNNTSGGFTSQATTP